MTKQVSTAVNVPAKMVPFRPSKTVSRFCKYGVSFSAAAGLSRTPCMAKADDQTSVGGLYVKSKVSQLLLAHLLCVHARPEDGRPKRRWTQIQRSRKPEQTSILMDNWEKKKHHLVARSIVSSASRISVPMAISSSHWAVPLRRDVCAGWDLS